MFGAKNKEKKINLKADFFQNLYLTRPNRSVLTASKAVLKFNNKS
jgi:hypothetical protein